jgi:hypothetical protein
MNIFNARFIGAIAIGGYFLYSAATPFEPHIVDAANLIFHEAGHTLFIFFGQFIHVLMGSGFQVLLPLLIVLYFIYNEKYFEAAICSMWVGENMVNVSIYAGDAVRMELPLLGGDSAYHDWHYILSTLGVLSWTDTVAMILSIMGFAIILGGLAVSCYFAATEKTS